MSSKLVVGLSIFFYIVFFFSWDLYYKYQEKTRYDYLGYRGLNRLTLTMTMFVLIFSGPFLMGVPDDSSQTGFIAYKWIGGTLNIMFSQLVIFPRLRKLARTQDYDSPTDFVYNRFHSNPLRLCCVFCMVMSTLLLLVCQFQSATYILDGIYGKFFTERESRFFFAGIVLIFTFLRSSRSAVQADTVHCSLLIIGICSLPFLCLYHYDSFSELMQNANKTNPDKFQTSDSKHMFDICSFMIGLTSFSLYPHVVQRVYYAKSYFTLRFTMLMMPIAILIIILPVFFVGLYHQEENNILPTASVLICMLDSFIAFGGLSTFFATITFVGVFATVMSASGSSLIAVSTVISIDIVKKHFLKSATKSRIGWSSKLICVISIFFIICLSEIQFDQTKLFAFQSGVMMQIVPTFILGMYSLEIQEWALFGGCIIGILIIFLLEFFISLNKLNVYLPSSMWAILFNLSTIATIQLYISLPFIGRVGLNSVDSRSISSYIALNTRNSVQISPSPLARYGSGEEHKVTKKLTGKRLRREMIMIREPILHCRLGFKILLIVTILMISSRFIFPHPVTTQDLIGGLPPWFLYVSVFTIIWIIVYIFMVLVWVDQGARSSFSHYIQHGISQYPRFTFSSEPAKESEISSPDSVGSALGYHALVDGPNNENESKTEPLLFDVKHKTSSISSMMDYKSSSQNMNNQIQHVSWVEDL